MFHYLEMGSLIATQLWLSVHIGLSEKVVVISSELFSFNVLISSGECRF